MGMKKEDEGVYTATIWMAMKDELSVVVDTASDFTVI